MNVKSPKKIALIGCGIGGTLILEHLYSALAKYAIRDTSDVEITIFNPESTLGAGLAFGADLPTAAINTTYNRLKTIGSGDNSFETWITSTNRLPTSLDDSPIPRSYYGAFSKFKCDNVIEALRRYVKVSVRKENVKDMSPWQPNALSIETASGTTETVDIAVLAVGTWPKPPLPDAIPCYPLTGLLDKMSHPCRHNVVIAGTSLSGVDACITFAQQGLPTTLISPSGKLPWVQTAEASSIPAKKRYLTSETIHGLDECGKLNGQAMLDLMDSECQSSGTTLNDILDGQGYDDHWDNPNTGSIYNRLYDKFCTLNDVLNAAYARLRPEEKLIVDRTLNGNWRRFRFRIPYNRWKQLKNFEKYGLVNIVKGDIRRGSTEIINDDTCLIDARGFSTALADVPFLSKMLGHGLLQCNSRGEGLWDPMTGAMLASDHRPSSHIFGIGSVTSGSNLITSALDVMDCQAKVIARTLAENIVNFRISDIAEAV